MLEHTVRLHARKTIYLNLTLAFYMHNLRFIAQYGIY